MNHKTKKFILNLAKEENQDLVDKIEDFMDDWLYDSVSCTKGDEMFKDYRNDIDNAFNLFQLEFYKKRYKELKSLYNNKT